MRHEQHPLTFRNAAELNGATELHLEGRRVVSSFVEPTVGGVTFPVLLFSLGNLNPEGKVPAMWGRVPEDLQQRPSRPTRSRKPSLLPNDNAGWASDRGNADLGIVVGVVRVGCVPLGSDTK
jgi:hypothetical protein